MEFILLCLDLDEQSFLCFKIPIFKKSGDFKMNHAKMTNKGADDVIYVYLVEQDRVEKGYLDSHSHLTVDSSLIESYIIDQEDFIYFGFDEDEEVDIYILEWSNLFQTMHDLRDLRVETIEGDFSIDELRALLEADEIHKLKQYLYRVVQNPLFSCQNYVVELRVDAVTESLLDI